MCTVLTYKNKDFYLGRTMDLSYSFQERVVITPRNYKLSYKKYESMDHHYSIIGMGTVIQDYPLYADAMNEEGLCMAGLNFPDNAYYHNKIENNKIGITPYELIPYILATCSTVKQAKEKLSDVVLLAQAFSSTIPLAPLHWMISDTQESIVVESTCKGLQIYDNPVGVMTNNPTFDYHQTNLSNYMGLSNQEKSNTLTSKQYLPTLSHGTGAIGLPGDASSVSRFIRAVFISSHAVSIPTTTSNLTQVFSMLDRVSVCRGEVDLGNDVYDYTTYRCCMDVTNKTYYYKTYENSQISAVIMNEQTMNESKLQQFELNDYQQIKYHNK